VALQSYTVWALRKSIKLLELMPYFAGGIRALRFTLNARCAIGLVQLRPCRSRARAMVE
jgi:hypothetical protein